MFSTYRESDVTILLKDITGLVAPQPSSVREPLIQHGVHYSEMLPLEYVPTDEYMSVYLKAVDSFSGTTASAVATLAEKIVLEKGQIITLVSLARAGISIGVLLKRYIEGHYDCDVAHYAISIIRGRGIDDKALATILGERDAASIQFVDGWTGKGAISRELKDALSDYPGIDSRLAVLSDPANVTPLCGTKEDFLIPSSCLNATISGLISRTFLRGDIIGPNDYHGAAFYSELAEKDLTYSFIDAVEAKYASVSALSQVAEPKTTGVDETASIARHYEIKDINLIKPGIGETTRVLLRRVPWIVLVSSMNDEKHLGHIYQLAEEKNVPVELYPLQNYRACGIIKEMVDC